MPDLIRPLVLLMTVTGMPGLAGCVRPGPAMTVEHHGPMREVLREGRTEPRVRLADAMDQGITVAVGALADLEGEITILDGEVWIARVEAGRLVMHGPEPAAEDAATLLSMARVHRWTRSPLVIATGDDAAPPWLEGPRLEEHIAGVARRQGLDVQEPFAFVIEGTMLELDLHVINGSCPRACRPTAATQPWRWSAQSPVEAIVVGVHASGRQGVMTHHGSSIHAHAILRLDGQLITGHIDRLRVGPASLRLPMQ